MRLSRCGPATLRGGRSRRSSGTRRKSRRTGTRNPVPCTDGPVLPWKRACGKASGPVAGGHDMTSCAPGYGERGRFLSRCTFERCGRKAGNLARRSARRHLERPGQLPAEDPAQQFQGRRAERVASPAIPAERTSLGDVESHERRCRRARATARAAVDYRAGTVEGQQFPVERGHHQGPGWLAKVRNAPTSMR